MSQITTHILDTSKGKPAEGVTIHLQKQDNDNWVTLGSGKTNSDGRVTDLLKENDILEPGAYRMTFEIESYFQHQGIKSFYPIVHIDFNVFDSSHYHIPLLLNPFGYSTYRGS